MLVDKIRIANPQVKLHYRNIVMGLTNRMKYDRIKLPDR